MESQLKMDHTASYGNEVGNVPNSSKSVPSPQYLLRILVFATTLVAAVRTAINKESQNIPLKLGPDLPTVFVPILAKSSHLSAFKYFIAVNAMVCTYAALSLLLSLMCKAGKSSPAAWIAAMDVIFIALLSTGIGAAGAVGVLGAKGNTHLGWQKVCNYYGKFCRHAGASILISLVGIAFLLLLIIHALLIAHRRR